MNGHGIPSAPRPYTDHHAYCLFYAKGTCGDCIDQCPVDALSKAGHDKVTCRAHLDRTKRYVVEHYGFDGYGCGLCQVGVPCESGIPEGIDVH
jgi:epoxyqueuosine reductase